PRSQIAGGAGETRCTVRTGITASRAKRRAHAGLRRLSKRYVKERSMSELYSECHRELQDRYGSRALADRLDQMIVHPTLSEAEIALIEARDFFFLSTVDPSGHPTVSYKGGAPGFVKVESNTIVFPCYDGNGMFLSVGNIEATAKVGLLFIDFETPRRLRV